jgi:DNA helicase II / ATP-dependent DNA helicase PcrA
MSESDRLLELLNPEQRAAVVHSGSPLLILAGAGSGKTRVITTKIAYLIAVQHVDPMSILAVTFTKKAANEMAERAVAFDPRASYATIRTFHSFGAWFLRQYANAAGVSPQFTVYDDDDMITLVSKAVSGLSRVQATHWARRIALAKDYCIMPEDLELRNLDDDPEFPEIYHAYEQRLHETGNTDFGDLIMLPVLVLRRDLQIRARLHDRFKVIMVDEYQDSNVAQFQLLQALSGTEDKNESYVCVVGDDDQSIYKFRGAEVQNILTFRDCFPDTTLIRLERNYRSTAEILRVADSVVRNNEGRIGKTLSAERGSGKIPCLIFLLDQDSEAQFCADLIQKSHETGCSFHHWAILYRTNAQSLTFETEFLHRKIPYMVVGSLKFYEREEIKDLLALLSFIANPRDEIAFRRMVNKPARGIGSTSQDKIIFAWHAMTGNAVQPDLLNVCRNSAVSLPKKAGKALSDFIDLIADFQKKLAADTGIDSPDEKLSLYIERLFVQSGLLAFHTAEDEIAGTQRAANMQELANSAVLYPCSMAGLLDFLDHIELDRSLDQSDDTADAVTLITLHNTKGLEFPRVVITGLESGIFPRQDKTGAELEEERRLFYVGITRAQNELYFTSCSRRRMYGRTEFMQPSPFLNEINHDSLKILGSVPDEFFYGARNGGADPLKKQWCIGTRVYHDEYGYGQIVQTATSSDGEYCVSVQFENSGIKKFLPRYQAHHLLIIKD